MASRSLVLRGGLSTLLALLSTATWAQPASDEDPRAPEDAVPAEEPQPPFIPAGHVPGEGFRLKSEDGAYLLRVALQAALKADLNWTQEGTLLQSSFGVLRPSLRGNVVRPWMRYWLSLELSRDSPYVLDAFVEVQPWEALGLRYGQQGTPVSRHEDFGPQQLFFPEHAAVANFFWSGRDQGLTLFGGTPRRRVDYYLGVYGGSPLLEPVNLPDDYLVEARATVSPLGPVNASELPFTPEGGPLPPRISFTVQGYFGRVQTDAENFNPSNSILNPAVPTTVATRVGTLSFDLWWQLGRIIVFGEFYWRALKPVGVADTFSTYGAWGQVLVNVYRNRLGAGVRMNWLDPHADITGDRTLELEAQVAWFIQAPELMLKLRYGWLDQGTPDAPLPTGVQLPFSPGTSGVTTLQLNLFL
ncbi:OprO/OprP family phosphate-selective porin [Myxococcus sp. XM-1-1-1]|uniref:OprO/OprP family phosphate-selective porin n=1 Tax=Myxococcus sp. XM-1-1-1 TaxID=2874602 RepID=UPI001CBAB27A|nr:OprO/OprP family phosphate-selective porin [Myxococcus sp. XM-1-1-1]MBZ4407767.1 OprO/OprP family phosphate-selective porin [Myxococcus sp. XM-1-1-1]